MQSTCVALFAALLLILTPYVVNAQDVTLTSRDGQIEIEGILLGYDGEFYRLETLYGELTVDGSGVNCTGAGCPNLLGFVAEFTVSGSATMGVFLVPALLEGFAQRNGYLTEREDQDDTHFTYKLTDSRSGKPAAVISFRVTNSDEGFADLLSNEADLVMSSREARSTEKQRALEAGMGDLSDPNWSRVIALDAIVPIVSPQNPVSYISPLNLARIYAGQISNWSAIGGADAPISLHAPSDETGLGQAVDQHILTPAGLLMTTEATRHARGSKLVEAVTRDPFALGVASYAEIGNAKALRLKGTCGRVLNATRRSIKTEDYPLTAPMFIYTPARRLPKIAREFLAFIRGPSAQVVVRRSGFVDQAAETVSIDEQGNRFANAIAAAGSEVSLEELQRMIATLAPLKRLTTSFRFETGSVQLDAQSLSNVLQLADDMERGFYDARELYFVGFSDGNGSADRNRDISLSRAQVVRDAVLQAAQTVDLSRVDVRVDGFGEALPLACDDSSWGRRANRRVEIWVR